MNAPEKANVEKQRDRKVLSPRLGWKQFIQEALQIHGNKITDIEWLNAPLTDDSDWESDVPNREQLITHKK